MSQKKYPHIQGSLIYDKGDIADQWEKYGIYNK